MKMEWVTVRPNGKPVEPGTFCRVLDMEDGTNPIYYYGKTEQEVNDKIALNNMHAQRALARRAEAPTNGTAPALPSPVTPRQRMTADETMRATADLQNPSKAGEAVTKLVQDVTGIDLRQMKLREMYAAAQEWEKHTPEFYPHDGNRRLVLQDAAILAGGDMADITVPMLDQAFRSLKERGFLFRDPLDGVEVPPNNVTPFPEETPVQRVETVRSGRNGTGTRSTNFRAPQNVQTRTLKYTREQIDRMPLAKTEALIRSGDKDYAEACEFYYPSAKASA
jgi:hypothetical protein